MAKAIVSFGSKQFEASVGKRILVDRMVGDVGKEVVWDKVLWVSTDEDGQPKIGKPHVVGAKVVFEIVGQPRGPRVVVFKKRSKKAYQKSTGFRADLTELLVKEIKV
ncbi:MAG: 50S ribosomal protein L21 [Elusimicrobiota bacterium]